MRLRNPAVMREGGKVMRGMAQAALGMVLYAWVSGSMAAESSTPLLKGDAERGRLIFATCRTCHYPEQSVGHNNGPSLWNIFALEVGSQPGFDYSPALREAEFVWTPELLDLWLQNPRDFLPGNQMMSAGEPDPQRRADLIEYLKQVSTPPAPNP